MAVESGTRGCIVCGTEFQPYRKNHLVCSRKCQSKTPKAKASLRAYQARPEIKARDRANYRLATAPDPEKVRLYNLRGALRKYGVTLEWLEAKLKTQGGACAICGHIPPPDGIKSAARLHVDHDHVTGDNRGLLCNRCNPGVGYFQDDPDLLRKAADYIERHRT
jgi:hypothetical protein